MPYAIKKIVKKVEFDKARAYGFDKSSYGFVSDLWNQLETVVYFAFGILPYFWDLAGQLLEKTAFTSELFQSLGFAGITCIIMTLTNLPFSLYFTFIIEQKHGFNKSTLGTFILDKIKTIFLLFVIGGPFLAGFIYLIDNHRQNFAFYVWAFVFSFQLFFYTIFPTFIQPLFNKFEPLPDGELKTKIDELAKRINFPLKKIFVVDGSKRSSHSNAYFFGLFNNKRIVLYDTLLEQCSTQEILAILGHELGHWKLDHIWKRLFAIQIHFFILLYTFGFVLNLDSLYYSFGFKSKPVVVGFLLFQYIYLPLESVAVFLTNGLSRKHEFEADAYAKKLGYRDHLKSGLTKLQIKNLGNMNPDWLYSVYHYTHPTLVERLNALDAK